MRVAVVGSRNFDDFDLMTEVLAWETSDADTIVSGGARGADSMAEEFSRLNNMKCEVIKADWDTYGKSAGFRRNRLIVENADRVIAFFGPGQPTKGTSHTINVALTKRLDVLVVFQR